MDITGKVLEIMDTQQISDKFRKREIVLEYATNPEYPEFVKFEFVQDRTDLLGNFTVGQEVQVWFDLKGRKWTDRQGEIRYFTTLQGWRISLAAGQQQQPDTVEHPPGQNPSHPQQPLPPTSGTPLPPTAGSYSDEIPF